MRRLILFSLTLLMTACATAPQGYWASPSSSANRAKDDLECRALAAQAASGAGGWTSVASLRDGIRQQPEQQYFNQCVESRGYRFEVSR